MDTVALDKVREQRIEEQLLKIKRRPVVPAGTVLPPGESYYYYCVCVRCGCWCV